jgi:AraC-like DNA-binding protein
MNRTQLYRKIHAITNQNVGDFIFSIRLVCAAKLMLNTTQTISEIAFRVGFKDNAHFTRRFKQYFKMTPSAFIKKFRKQNN